MSRRYRKTKTKNILILTIFIVIVLFIINRNNITSTHDYYKTTTGLNVRTGIGKKYPISFTLQEGDEVKLLSKHESWYKIQYAGKMGYAHSKYITKERVISPLDLLTSKEKNNVSYLVVIGILAIVIIPISFNTYRKFQNKKLLETVTQLNRGTPAERDLALRLLKHGKSKEAIFHDLYVKKHDNSFSQIDLVLITEVGIILFEVKDYGGWIYGNGRDVQWTKVLAYGKQKYKFQNPVIQNNNHIVHLKNVLNQYGQIPIYSVIVFYGDCVLKNINFIPDRTFITNSARVLEVIQKIINDNPSFEYKNREEIIGVLRKAVANGNDIEIQHQHISNVRDLLGTDRIFD